MLRASQWRFFSCSPSCVFIAAQVVLKTLRTGTNHAAVQWLYVSARREEGESSRPQHRATQCAELLSGAAECSASYSALLLSRASIRVWTLKGGSKISSTLCPRLARRCALQRCVLVFQSRDGAGAHHLRCCSICSRFLSKAAVDTEAFKATVFHGQDGCTSSTEHICSAVGCAMQQTLTA